LAVSSVLVWAAVLPWTQSEQVRKRRVERLIAEKRFGDALKEMSLHESKDYTPGWGPPPRVLNLLTNDDFLLLLEEMARIETADWVRDAYLDKVTTLLGAGGWGDERLIYRLPDALKQIPDGPGVVERLEERGEAKAANALKGAMRREEKKAP
jgi:hypothetical protein